MIRSSKESLWHLFNATSVQNGKVVTYFSWHWALVHVLIASLIYFLLNTRIQNSYVVISLAIVISFLSRLAWKSYLPKWAFIGVLSIVIMILYGPGLPLVKKDYSGKLYTLANPFEGPFEGAFETTELGPKITYFKNTK